MYKQVSGWWGWRLLAVLAVLWVLLSPMHGQAAATSMLPQALLVVVDSDTDTMSVHVDLGASSDVPQTWQLPAGAQVQVLRDSPLPDAVEALTVPSKMRRWLRFDGKPTATAAPTPTPYVRGTVDGTLDVTQRDASLAVAPAQRGAQHRFVEIRCATCDAEWVLIIMNQLPRYAPIVVYAPGAVDWPGLWRIQAKPVAETSLPALGQVVTLFERTSESVQSRPTWNGQRTRVTQPPERFVEADGRIQLMRLTVCLVGVLLCSLAGFYLAVAVMRRMHAAVGYRADDQK